jgi:hypothetical protein
VPQNELIKRTRQVIKHSDELRHRSEACRRRADGLPNLQTSEPIERDEMRLWL